MTTRSRVMKIAAVVVGLVVAFLVLVLATSEPRSTNPDSVAVLGKVAPETVGTTLQGDTVDLRDLRGRWVVVNFFATWCPGCVTEHPELVEFTERNDGPADPALVSVVYQDQRDLVVEFFDDFGGDWPVLVGDSDRLATLYGVTAMPETYLVSPSGRVVTKWIGFTGVTADELEAAIADFATAPEPADG